MRQKLQHLWPHLNERSRRMLAAAEAAQIGYGGVSLVSRACGLSRVTILKGIRELGAPALPPERVRRVGGGRHALVQQDPQLPEMLESLVEPLARGDPESPLRWTCKSTRTLAGELSGRRHPISHEKVAQLLRQMNYSLQGNRKTEEGEDHPDRDAQFRHINRQVQLALRAGQPVISVDTKKKELIGNFHNAGQQWRQKAAAERVGGHDFPHPSVPRAYREGSIALGATKWQTIWRVTLPAARNGVLTGVMLGVGRAMGETMTVMMVTGNAPVLPTSLQAIFMPVRTMTATIASEMGEVANGSPHYHVLFFIGVVLFVFSLVVNATASMIGSQRRKRQERILS